MFLFNKCTSSSSSKWHHTVKDRYFPRPWRELSRRRCSIIRNSLYLNPKANPKVSRRRTPRRDTRGGLYVDSLRIYCRANCRVRNQCRVSLSIVHCKSCIKVTPRIHGRVRLYPC